MEEAGWCGDETLHDCKLIFSAYKNRYGYHQVDNLLYYFIKEQVRVVLKLNYLEHSRASRHSTCMERAKMLTNP